MSKITDYGSLTSPQSDDVLPIVDVHDTTMAPSGTTKKIEVGSLPFAQVPAGDLGGTSGDPQVVKIQGTPVGAPPGTGTKFLRDDGSWQVPADNDTGFLEVANNLSDLVSAATARANLGLGSAALQPASAFDPAGAAAAAQAAAEAASLPLTGGTVTGSVHLTDGAIINGITQLGVTQIFAALNMQDNPINNVQNGAAASDAVTMGQLTAAYPTWVPGDLGLLTATFDPLLASDNGSVGNLQMLRIPVRAAMTVSKLRLHVYIAASAPTSSGSFAGLYAYDNGASEFNLLTSSADIGSLVTSEGPIDIPLTTPQALSAGESVYAALMVNMTNAPSFAVLPQFNQTMANYGWTPGRFLGVSGAGTSLPASIPAASTSLSFYATPLFVGAL